MTVSVQRRIEAPAETIFAILCDPARHVDLDGSGMVRSAVSAAPVTAAGDVFVTAMLFERLGPYEMINHVVELEPDRRIAWEPEAGRGHPDVGTPTARWGQRWAYDLVPDGPGATVVAESYDCSLAPEDERRAMDDGRVWLEAMTETLERLDALCSSVAQRGASSSPSPASASGTSR